MPNAMDAPMPSFTDDILNPPPPKKPRPRPQRKAAKKKASRKSRDNGRYGDAARSAGAHQTTKKRVPKKRAKVAKAAHGIEVISHAGGKHSREVYAAIGTLMSMKGSDRETVLDIVHGLCSK